MTSVLKQGPRPLLTWTCAAAVGISIWLGASAALGDIVSGLTIHYKFDETNGVVAKDASGSANDASLIKLPADGTPYWVAGRIGGALEFCADGGDDDQVVTDNPVTLTNQDTFTFTFWAKRKSDNNPFNPRLMGPVRETDGQYWVLWSPNAGVGFYPPAKSAEPIRDVWQHFVVTYNRPLGKYSLYVNGLKKVDAQNAGYIKLEAGLAQWVVGHKELLNDNRDPWRGYLDDVRMYNRILTDADILELYSLAPPLPPTIVKQPRGGSYFTGENIQLSVVVDGSPPITYQWKKNGTEIGGATNDTYLLMNAQTADAAAYTVVASNVGGGTASPVANIAVQPVAGITTALSGHWKFDETTGVAVKDASGKGNDGSVFPADAQWTSGKVGGALTFRGPGQGEDYVMVPNFPRATNTMTLSAWVFAEARPNRARIACGASGGNGIGQFMLNLNGDDGDLIGYISKADGTSVNTREGVDRKLPTNQWQHVALVADGITARVYRNGHEVAQVAYDGTIWYTTNALSIGARLTVDDTSSESGWWQGKIDDMGYWTRGLTPNEIVAIFVAGRDGKDLTQANASQAVAPIILQQPVGGVYVAGNPLSLAVEASGTVPLSYQWKHEGLDIANATNAIFSIAHAQVADAGSYTVVIHNPGGNTTSQAALITVNNPPMDLSSALVLHLKFDETSGLVAHDSSGLGNNASLVNFPAGNPWVPGIIGNAIQMNALTNDAGLFDDQVLTDNPIVLTNSDQFSFAFWCKSGFGGSASPLNPRVIAPWQVTHWILWRSTVGVGIWPNVPQVQEPNSDWHHYVVVFDRAAQRFNVMVDGAVAAYQVQATEPKADPGNVQWTIGYPENTVNYVGDEWHGVLDDVRMYSRLLNPVDARGLYELGRPPAVPLTITNSGSGVVIRWPLDAAGYVLEAAPSLPSSTWTNVPGVVNNSVTVVPGPGNLYYRLKK